MSSARKFDLVLFDMDGTLTEVRSPWEYLHRRLGLWDGIGDRHLEAWLAGRIDYETFFRLDVELWLGRPRDRLLGLLDEIPLKPGAVEALRALHEAGIEPVILSTGFTQTGRRIAAAAGVPLPVFANELRFDDAGRFASMELAVSGDEASPLSKRAFAARIIETHGTTAARTAAVGDSEGDRGMFAASGLSLGVCGAPALGQDHTLPGPDLRACLEYLL